MAGNYGGRVIKTIVFKVKNGTIKLGNNYILSDKSILTVPVRMSSNRTFFLETDFLFDGIAFEAGYFWLDDAVKCYDIV